MKKLVLPIAFLAILIAGCKKENVQPVSSPALSMEQQVADLIAKGDPELYNKIYNRDPNSRAPEPEVKITTGSFIILQGDVASGTCWPSTSVCHITVTWPALVTDSTEETYITSNYYAEFAERGEGEIIMNASEPYTIHDLRSVDIRFIENGKSTVTCKRLQ